MVFSSSCGVLLEQIWFIGVRKDRSSGKGKCFLIGSHVGLRISCEGLSEVPQIIMWVGIPKKIIPEPQQYVA